MPVQLQRAMAAEAEAAREARAKVVAAEGEQKASVHLKEAAVVLEQSNSALQLRYLQVLSFWIPAQCRTFLLNLLVPFLDVKPNKTKKVKSYFSFMGLVLSCLMLGRIRKTSSH